MGIFYTSEEKQNHSSAGGTGITVKILNAYGEDSMGHVVSNGLVHSGKTIMEGTYPVSEFQSRLDKAYDISEYGVRIIVWNDSDGSFILEVGIENYEYDGNLNGVYIVMEVSGIESLEFGNFVDIKNKND